MSSRTRDDSHYKQYAVFADNLAHLDEEGWSRLRANCAELNSTSFSALVARARLGAKSQALIYPDALKDLPGTLAAVNAAAQAVLHQPTLDRPTIAEVYAYVEPVIPFASLTAQS